MKSETKRKTEQLSGQRIREEIAALRPIDDLFMRKLFHENLSLTQFVLRLITEIPDLEVISVETQADLKQFSESRSIVLDILAKDSENRLYNLEIQRSDDGASPQRARYHSACMDVNALKAGQSFRDLPDSYVIFITESDYFELGEPIYDFEYCETDSNEPLGDGSHILYVNGTYTGNDSVGHLMHDFICNDPDKMYYYEFAEAARPYKDLSGGEMSMGSVIQRLFEEGKAEGVMEGKETGLIEGKAEMLKNLMKAMNLSAEDAMNLLGITDKEKELISSKF